MSSATKFHSDISEAVPWQAQYSFPTQSTKCHKQIVKLVPKNGQQFSSSARLRIEFPADNYMNGLNSFLSFDMQIDDALTADLYKYSTRVIKSGVNFNVLSSETISIEDSSNVASPFYNPQWAGLGTALQGDGNRLTGFCIRILQGKHAGLTARITRAVVTGAPMTKLELFTDLGDEFQVTEEDIFEIIPGYRLPFGGAHNLINRLRVMYGSLVLEDLQNYSTLARTLLQSGAADGYYGQQGSMLDGTSGGHHRYNTSNWRTASYIGQGNVDDSISQLSQSIEKCHDSVAMINRLGTNMHPAYWKTAVAPFQPASQVNAQLKTIEQPQNTNLNLFADTLCNQKLIPLKWMASQLAFEIEWNSAARAFQSPVSIDYSIINVNYICEMLEFDSTYDSAFYMGLQSTGVPIKYSSWHYHQFNWTGSSMVAQIQERARSVKSVLAVTRRPQASFYVDNDRFYHAIGEKYLPQTSTPANDYATQRNLRLSYAGAASISQFQFRVGGRYYPAQPVNCSGGAAEAMSELMKVMNYLADYTRAVSIDNYAWSSYFWGGGDKFVVAGLFENSDAFPGQISGMNAEEQSDIQLSIQTEAGRMYPDEPVDVTKQLCVFVNYDSIMVVRDKNLVDLVL